MLACDNITVQRRGTITLEVIARDMTPFQHDFEVIEGDDDLLLGPDAMSKVGIAIHGIPAQFPDDQPGRAAAQQAQDAEQELHQRPAPWSVEDRVDEDTYDSFMTSIADLLQENADLDPTLPACSTIPETTMHLPLSAPWSFRHQYNLSQLSFRDS